MDWNNDGRKDLITGASYDDGRIKIYLNTGTDAAPVFSGYTFLQVAGADYRPGNRSMPEIVDWNNDGLLDVLCGEEALGRVHLLINSGTPGIPVFSTSNFVMNGASVLSIGSGYRSAPVVADWNGDGKKDLLIGNYFGTIYYFENKGTDVSPQFNGSTLLRVGGSNLDVGYYSRPEAADWDGDGLKDLLVGNYDGEVWFFRAIHPDLPHIHLQSNLMTEQDGDGYLELGERGYVTCTLKNGSAAGSNVVAVLSTSNAWCTVEQGVWTIGTMASNATVSNAGQPYEFTVAIAGPPGETLVFRLDVTANDGAYSARYFFEYRVAEPVLLLGAWFVNDSQGNTNGLFNPGETIHMTMRVTNADYRAENVIGTLSCASPFVNITQATGNFGVVEKRTSSANIGSPFCIQVLSNAPARSAYLLNLGLSYDTCVETGSFSVVVGRYVADPSAPFSWQDTTGGTSLSIGLLGYRSVSLPFSFPLYGKQYSTAYVTSNGQILFETASGSYYANIPISDPGIPNAMLAPYWDVFYPSIGGTIRHRTFGSVPRRYWVVEWNAVPFYYDTVNTATFQAILHEDGKICFQYGAMAGVYAYGASATVGIEDPSGSTGVMHACDQSLSVTNGQAIEFDVDEPDSDTDDDGMLDMYEEFYFGNLAKTGTEDTDGDGMTDRKEFYCGTDPTDPGSVLCLKDIVPATGEQFVIRWFCVPGLPYHVQGRAGLTEGDWSNVTIQPVTGPVSGVGAYTTTVGDANSSFYRVRTP